ncbi:MAG TPA: chemotaxis protein CheW [Terriglobales bacterium]|nr:chemotaxis protein CheW [Terriglobales bacterium]
MATELAALDETQYVTFALAGQEYGVDILRVHEIRGYSPITPIPHARPHVKGVMNLRGTVIPVIDLRLALRLPPAECTPFTVIIVVAVGPRVVGLVVDAVSEVLTLPRVDVQAPPALATDVEGRFVQGLARAAGALVILLDLDVMLGGDEPGSW